MDDPEKEEAADAPSDPEQDEAAEAPSDPEQDKAVEAPSDPEQDEAAEAPSDPLCQCAVCQSVFLRKQRDPKTGERFYQKHCPWDGHDLHPLVGSVMGSYRLEVFLDMGGFAAVYRGAAVDKPQIKKAVKVLKPSPSLSKEDCDVFLEDATKMHQAAAGGNWPDTLFTRS